MKRFIHAIRLLLMVAGFFFVVAVTGAVFGLPSGIIAKMAEYGEKPVDGRIDYIVLLPAGDIPSPGTLMRAYSAATEWKKYPGAKVIITRWTSARVDETVSERIAKELFLRGVPQKTVLFEKKAGNTYQHAFYIKEGKLGDPAKDRYLIVTSPFHILRATLVFRAQGFEHLFATPAWSAKPIGGLGPYPGWRYVFWDELINEILIVREFLAIGWYKASGKI